MFRAKHRNESHNVAARLGRWSAGHWKTAVFGWLALVAAIEAAGGTIAKQEYWGVKTLAYRIRKNRKAHFQLLNIDAPHAAVAEMERQMSINEDVLRFLTIRVDAHEEGPSAQMRRRDESERRDRDEGFGGFGRGDRFGRSDRGDRGPRRDAPRRDEEGGAPAPAPAPLNVSEAQ